MCCAHFSVSSRRRHTRCALVTGVQTCALPIFSRRHRLDPDGLSLTLRAGSGADHGSFTAVVPIHPKGTRVVTAREAARLHSIPDWVQLSKTKIWAYRQIGNSVPPLLGRAVARSIMNAAGLAPAAPVDIVPLGDERSEEHTSELQSLMRISYAVFCLKKKKNKSNQ